MKCPNCEGCDLIEDTRNVLRQHQGRSALITNVTGGFCPVCGGVFPCDDDAAHIEHAEELLFKGTKSLVYDCYQATKIAK